MPAVRVRLCGSFTVTLDGATLTASEWGSRRARLLLMLLAARRHRTVVTDEIVEVVWPDGAPDRPDAAVATLVSRLRSALGAEVVVGSRGAYRLGSAPFVELDLDLATGLLGEAERRFDAEPVLAASAASRALALVADPVLADRPYDAWADPVRGERDDLLRRGRHLETTAALRVGDFDTARAVAAAAVDEDPLDEAAARDLMSAHHAAGEQARALAVYGALRRALRDELGIDPGASTRHLHLGILRDEVVVEPMGAATTRANQESGLPGRDAEVAILEEHWAAAVRGEPRTVVLVGESGIGKTRLAEEVAGVVERTGGIVLRARCYESEQSMFLQPIVDALSGVLATMSAAVVDELAGDDAALLSGLLPTLGQTLAVAPEPGGTVAVRRRRMFDALAALFGRLSRRAPVLLVVDDLHNAGRSTVEWLDFQSRHAGNARLLVLGTARVERASPLRTLLGPAVQEIELGPLDRAAVEQLARRTGRLDLVDEILHRTSGHTLYVVSVLGAVASGATGLPATLNDSVLDRLAQLGPDESRLLRAAAVLGARFDPAMLATLVGMREQTALVLCERALEARLLIAQGAHYEFAHDVVREVLYATTPTPTRVALHRRAADLSTDNPESVAEHAEAAGDPARAARAWLIAAETALRRLAVLDAEALASRALDAANLAADRSVGGRALLVRGRARDAAASWVTAHEDIRAAVVVARETGDRRLEMQALRQLSGDVPVGVGLPVHEYARHLEEAQVIARALGDREMQVDLLARQAVICVNRLLFSEALQHGRDAVELARSSGSEAALCQALDGLKTGYAYLGEAGQLGEVILELEPMLRARQDLFLLQWVIFESAFVPLAAGDFASADRLFDAAIAMCRHSGWVSYQGWFLAHRGWAARLAGDLSLARDYGRESVQLADEHGHFWWQPAALAIQAETLLAVDDAATALTLLERALPVAADSGVEGYRLRALGVYAEASGSEEALREAEQLLAQVDCPPGSAWLLGADAYLAIARALLARGEPGRALEVVEPLIAAARRVPFRPLLPGAEAVRERAVVAAT